MKFVVYKDKLYMMHIVMVITHRHYTYIYFFVFFIVFHNFA